MDAAANAQKIVEALKETEAESEANRVLSARAVELLHQAGLTRIVSPAAYGGYQLPVRDLVEAERVDRARQHGSLMGIDGVRGPHLHRRPDAASRPGRDFRRRSRHADSRRAVAARHLPAQPGRIHPQRTVALRQRRRPRRLGPDRLQGHSQRSGRGVSCPDRRDAQEGRRHRRHLVHPRHARHRLQGRRARQRVHSRSLRGADDRGATRHRCRRRHPALPAAHPSGAGHHAAGHHRRDGRAGLADLRGPDPDAPRRLHRGDEGG